MRAVERIYEGYALTKGAYEDSEGTGKAVQELADVIEKMLPMKFKGQEVQNEVFSAAVVLAEETEKQGFIAGFNYALRMMKEC